MLFRLLVDILFPLRCLSCRVRGVRLCTSCLADIHHAGPTELPWCLSVFPYKHPHIRKSLWELKYKHRKVVAQDFGRSLADITLELMTDIHHFVPDQYVLIPIPLSPIRERERGYNQAFLLAEALTSHLPNLRLEKNILKKKNGRDRQAHISKKGKRLENMCGVFYADSKKDMKQKTFILIDDVTTSGATLIDARRALRKAGAVHIYAVTVAH